MTVIATRSMGSAGTMYIDDNGSSITVGVSSSDPATFTNGHQHELFINGVGQGVRTVALGTVGSSPRWLANYPLSYSASITFRQYATGTMGLGGQADLSATITRSTVPAQVAQPTVSEQGLNTMRVSWSSPSNGGAAIDQFLLRRYPTAADRAADTNYSQYVLSGSTTTHKPTDLAPGEDYWWVVYAHNSNGYSPQSPFRIGYTTDAAPNKPSAPSLTSKTSTQIVTSHADPVNTGSPILERALEMTVPADGTVIETRNSATSSQTWNGRTRATQHGFRYRVRNAVGWSEWSDALVVNTPGTPPSAPANYIAYDVASTSAVISLGSLADNGGEVPTKVRVKVSTTNSDVGLVQTVVGDEWLPLPVYGLTPNTLYYVSEAAYNNVEGGGWGPYGPWVPFTMKNNVPTHPQGVTITDIFDDQATAEWLAPSSLLGASIVTYRTRVARNKQMTTDVVEYPTPFNDLDKILPDLTAGNTYWVEVHSMSSAGRGSAAAPVSFVTTGGAAPDDGFWANVPGVGLRHGKMWANVPGVGIRQGKLWAHVPGVGVRAGV